MSRYVSLLPLAVGGMSELSFGVLFGAAGYRRAVVLKRARATVGDDARAARRALVREAHVAAALGHPNVVHVYELTDTPEGLTLAMEYLPGVSLLSLLAELGDGGTASAPPWPIALRIAADAARGLAHAHAARGPDGAPLGIVHRDVSPKNLLVTEEGITKVVDFGIARSALRAETVTTTLRGTAAYMSPEQARGHEVDWRTDVFALGIVLHEMLAGAHPFDRDDASATMQAIVSAPAPPLPSALPAPLTDLVGRMLVKDPRRRVVDLTDAADLLEALATPNGGRHRDVAMLLTGELGAQLAVRRQRVGDLLRGAAVRPRAPSTLETASIVLLERALDEAVVSVSDEHRPFGGEVEGSDTISDDAYEDAATLVRDEDRRR